MAFKSENERKLYFQKRRLKHFKLSKPIQKVTINEVQMVLKRTEAKCPNCKRRLYQVATTIERIQGKMPVCQCALGDLLLYADVIAQERSYDKELEQKEKPALQEADPWKALEVTVGHSVDVHTSHHGYRHTHISKEDIAKVEANTPFGRAHRRVKSDATLQEFLQSIGKCSDCESKPIVYVTEARIPLCARHWQDLANTDIQWG